MATKLFHDHKPDARTFCAVDEHLEKTLAHYTRTVEVMIIFKSAFLASLSLIAAAAMLGGSIHSGVFEVPP